MLRMRIWRTNAHTNKTNALCQNHRTRPIRRLRRPLVPSVTKDSDIRGLALHVTSTRSFWALTYQPRGINPSTGKRWGGGVRYELGDAMLMTVAEARTAAWRPNSRQGRRKPPSRKQSPPRPPLWPSDCPAVNGRRSPRSLHGGAHEPTPALRGNAPQIHPLRSQGRQADEGRADSSHRAHPRNGPRHARNHAGIGRRAPPRLPRTRPLSRLERKQGLSNQPMRQARPRRKTTRRHGARSRPIAGRTARVWNAVEDEPNATSSDFCCSSPLRRNEAGAWRGAKSTCSAAHPNLSEPRENPRSPRTAVVGTSDGDPRGANRRKANWFFPTPTAIHTRLP